MQLLKIKPLSIIYRDITNGYKSQKTPYYSKPRKIDIIFSELKKHHVLIVENGALYYSFQLCAMLECFNFDISKIHNLEFKEGSLYFNTIFGEYQAGDLIEINEPLF